MQILVVYDDTILKSEVISDVIGEKGFAEVVVLRQTIGERFLDAIGSIYDNPPILTFSSIYDMDEFLATSNKKYANDTRVLHFFSNVIISNLEIASLTLQKIHYIDETYALRMGENVAGIMFPDFACYLGYLNNIMKNESHSSIMEAKNVEQGTSIDGVNDISKIENFIQCVTGNFDARYFNTLQGDEYTIIKSSTNISKIHAEYTFYHILPEDMQFWFVEPFSYVETDSSASYTMERLHMTDLAIKWVHGSIDETEFSVILDKYFYFFNHRHDLPISKEEYQKISNSLYVEKVSNRIAELKDMEVYQNMEKLLSLNGTSIDQIVNRYFTLKNELETRFPKNQVSVIGHGDPCFANTMYNKSTRALKFIDPKGAMTESELWTNPYYDIAKLSHSICGRYDFFNNGLFEISIGEDFHTELKIDFDNTKFIELFRKKLEENGYHYWLVRLYEASLFLSMLPLHIDNPQKVYGFILNANNILKEIEKHV